MEKLIIALLVIVVLFLVALAWDLYRRLKGKREAEHYIEDILKHFFSRNKEAWTLEDIRVWKSIDEETLRKYLRIAERRGWVHLTGSYDNIVVITPAGLTYGSQMSRAHRIYERYLAERTSYPKDEWHPRAELKEHILTPTEVEEMSRSLGHPLFDPSGEPIPPRVGGLPDFQFIALDEITDTDTIYTVAALPDDEKERVLAFSRQGLIVGALVKVESIGHTARLVVEGQTIEVPEHWQPHVLLKHKETDTPLPEGLIPLSKLKPGERAVIVRLKSVIIGEKRRRLSDLGFVKGGEVSVYMGSPLGHPVAYLIRDTAIALRRDQSDHILVQPLDQTKEA
ncbi:metal-dependent transcriptional regulator [Porphyromonas sp.]|uniref:metal-dependent transcriptional regulator n=1 Tax=Porphyromonas sp. TaxID=1924944 RepID=UPI0026DD64B2|nr:metal-dependent transcriptional regulator [Porphyromonas sp.]MDO4770398.1 metal-dependent transcriptional regulator [Porphyromonas sp.]